METRNFTCSRRAKTCLIFIFSTNTGCESGAFQLFGFGTSVRCARLYSPVNLFVPFLHPAGNKATLVLVIMYEFIIGINQTNFSLAFRWVSAQAFRFGGSYSILEEYNQIIMRGKPIFWVVSGNRTAGPEQTNTELP